MDALKAMWETVPPATPDDLARARRRLIEEMGGRRRLITVPRLLVAAAAAAAVVIPLINGLGTPAYAVTKNPDGTITVTVNELRDPAGLEAELRSVGIKADVSFLAPHTRCAGPRFAGVDPSYGTRPHTEAELKWGAEHWRSLQVIKAIPAGHRIGIHPEYIRPDETLVLEIRDDQNPKVLWTLGAWLAEAGTPVKPCTPVKD
ncbi:hypothetical protein [Microbispora corallina]|nr:hypothetical protein [Microbispora corallina]